MSTTQDNRLGNYLKNRRARLDPVAFGYPSGNRRTPGLRREEVALRANISATWYTWLEQGRGGVPSTAVLERIASALDLTTAEREHLFLLAQDRPPELRHQTPGAVSDRLQRILDAMPLSPAFVRTASWDIVARNQAALKVLGDYENMPPQQRNTLRMLFGNPEVRKRMVNWEEDARSVVATFRAESTRAGAPDTVRALVADMIAISPDFASMWHRNEVRTHGEGTKHIMHPVVGLLTLDYSAFAVDGQPDLSMIVYNPASPEDIERVRVLIGR
ncbi:helix-turn-helix transcriptional regulator [Silvimonas amylolytica]|uniref:Transcriptional regulator n=1 Tax=Silvimonas amylolytica TaxID=449663 RepID=A0ABQ2PMP8_9NEIS|nr:helix-turn-helix transcriptional regulator [Silvimonas amylolytica]GGP26884.1 transcriptional regulator [Silvimonas amylolytica]